MNKVSEDVRQMLEYLLSYAGGSYTCMDHELPFPDELIDRAKKSGLIDYVMKESGPETMSVTTLGRAAVA